MARKLSDAGPLEKFIALFDLLLTERHPVTLKEMADELGCSRQTASRLLTKLELSDVGRKYLEVNRTRTVTARFRRQRGLPTLNLNAEGFFQLILCRDFMLNLLPATVRSQVDTTLKRAAEYVDGSVPVPDDLLHTFPGSPAHHHSGPAVGESALHRLSARAGRRDKALFFLAAEAQVKQQHHLRERLAPAERRGRQPEKAPRQSLEPAPAAFQKGGDHTVPVWDAGGR